MVERGDDLSGLVGVVQADAGHEALGEGAVPVLCSVLADTQEDSRDRACAVREPGSAA